MATSDQKPTIDPESLLSLLRLRMLSGRVDDRNQLEIFGLHTDDDSPDHAGVSKAYLDAVMEALADALLLIHDERGRQLQRIEKQLVEMNQRFDEEYPADESPLEVETDDGTEE